jgi:hypothetical protein
MPHIVRVFTAALACAMAVSVTCAKAASVDDTPVPQASLDALRRDLGMAEMVSLLSASATRSSSKTYLETKATYYRFIETKSQGAMVVDAYTVLDQKSHIIGYSLFYRGESGPLVIANAVVNPTEKDAVGVAAKLVAASLDSVSLPGGAKVYFLGIQNLDSSQIVKIMIRAEGQSPAAAEYSIRYVVTGR